jgi:signal transduction histidine kinase
MGSLFGESNAMGEGTTAERIVVIDDDHAIRFSCRKILSKSGYSVEDFEDGLSGVEAVAELKPALVLVDLKMPGMSGMEVVSRLHEIDPHISCIVITGYATIDTAIEAMKCGAYDFLPKPFSPEELRIIVNRGLERRRLALQSHRHELDRALLKRRFVTFVSHQLQTPLVAVHQYLDVLKHLGDTPDAIAKRQEWLERCLQRTEELQALIKEWLTLAKMESFTYSHQRVKIDAGEVIAGILKAYEELAAAEQIGLESRLPEERCFVTGDRDCVSVLIDNLVTNAIKYNKPGGTVTVTAEPSNGEILISVADTGSGIAEESLPFLFEEFFRIKRDDPKRIAGSGLGLAICKKVISEMGGSIAVESKVNEGSTFRVRLPAWHEQQVREKHEEAEEQPDH